MMFGDSKWMFLQFMVNKIMQLASLCLLLSIAISQMQLVPQLNKAKQGKATEEKVMQFVIQSYPQLSNFTLIYHSIVTKNQQNKDLELIYYYFIFQNDSDTYSNLATLLHCPQELVSISPLVVSTEGSDRFTSAGEGQSKKGMQRNGSKELKEKGVGGYQAFTNITDTRLDKAQAFIASLHPSILNYWKEFSQYQIVSGVNFIIEYIGLDGITSATAQVNIDIDLYPQLLSFQVHCQLTNLSNLLVPCTDELALRIFNAHQILFVVRPELLHYKLESMVSDDTYLSDGILFIETFQNISAGTRIIIQINIEENGITIMSYYSYRYPFQ